MHIKGLKTFARATLEVLDKVEWAKGNWWRSSDSKPCAMCFSGAMSAALCGGRLTEKAARADIDGGLSVWERVLFARMENEVRRLTGCSSIEFNDYVAESEKDIREVLKRIAKDGDKAKPFRKWVGK